MSRFLYARHAGLTAYVPGEQPQDMSYIKLNTNESPYPPSPGVLACINGAEAARLRLYSDPQARALRGKLAGLYGVTPENVLVTNGSDETLAFAFIAFCGAARGMAFPDITYGFYPVYSDLLGVPAHCKPLRADFTVDTRDYLGLDENIVIANPNAPTGLALSLADIEKIALANPDRVVIIDEAYVDFGAASAVPLTARYDNLLVIQTYSKSRSMAGARLGYAIGNAELIADLDRIRRSFNPYNVNRLTLLAGAAAIDDEAYYQDMRRRIIKTRGESAQALRGLGFTMTDSAANFLFASHPDMGGGALYGELKKRGILVRQFDKPRISDYLRITVGTDEQMSALTGALKMILERGVTDA